MIVASRPRGTTVTALVVPACVVNLLYICCTLWLQARALYSAAHARMVCPLSGDIGYCVCSQAQRQRTQHIRLHLIVLNPISSNISIMSTRYAHSDRICMGSGIQMIPLFLLVAAERKFKASLCCTEIKKFFTRNAKPYERSIEGGHVSRDQVLLESHHLEAATGREIDQR